VCGDEYRVPYHDNSPRYKAWHLDCGGTGFYRVYYCTQACYRRQLRARHRAERERTVICRSCGGAFGSTRRDARYCSGACRQDAYRQRGADALA
jgi:hypothetical protein